MNKVENPLLLRRGSILGVFAKEPLPGRVKTRLTPPLSPQEAADLYTASLEETLASMEPFSPVVFYAGERAFFREHFPGSRLIPQGDGDLGARFDRAFAKLFNEGLDRVVIIGSDTPDLPAHLAGSAFDALQSCDAVTAPAADGGYVLIGQRTHHPALFCDIPWSTSDVLAATRRAARRYDIALAEIAGWEDVDDVDSLRRLIERSPSSATARLGKELLTCLGKVSP